MASEWPKGVKFCCHSGAAPIAMSALQMMESLRAKALNEEREEDNPQEGQTKQNEVQPDVINTQPKPPTSTDRKKAASAGKATVEARPL